MCILLGQDADAGGVASGMHFTWDVHCRHNFVCGITQDNDLSMSHYVIIDRCCCIKALLLFMIHINITGMRTNANSVEVHINTWWISINVIARLSDWQPGNEGRVTNKTDKMTVEKDRQVLPTLYLQYVSDSIPR